MRDTDDTLGEAVAMGREQLGELEHQVLLAVLRQEAEQAYTAPVVMELEERTGRSTTASAVYVVLRRLEEKGLLTSEMRDAPPGEGGRARRHFEVTGEGRERLLEARDAYVRLWEGLDEVLEAG